MNELITEYQIFLPLLFFPFSLLGSKVRKPHTVIHLMLVGNSSQQRQRWHEWGQDCSARPGLLLWSGQLHRKLQSLQWQEENINKLLRKDVLWVTSLRAAHFGAYRTTARQSRRTVLLEIWLQEKWPPSDQHKCHSCWWKTFSNNNNETLGFQGMTHKGSSTRDDTCT